jgi:riboflavin kinase/FMN adenylyltransferase
MTPKSAGPDQHAMAQANVICIGVFDGVHLGHLTALARARAVADERSSRLVAMTFDPHPMALLRPEAAPRMLATLPHRERLLIDAGADLVHVLPFDTSIARLSPREFARTYLSGMFNAKAVVVGANFRFGKRASGDVAELSRLGAEMGFEVYELELADDGSGLIWSSTEIRQMVASGAVEAAAEGLARLHRSEGPVVRGDRRGREMGYPTANVEVDLSAAIPAEGVYAGWLVRNPYPGPDSRSHRMPAAISVGANHTFDGVETRVEAFVIDAEASLDLYGEYVAVDFQSRLRPMERFDSVGDLTNQMELDVVQSRAILLNS